MNQFEPQPPKAASPLELLEKALETHEGKTITLGDLREAFGDRSFGFLLLVSSIPSIIPIPGIGSIFGLLPMWFGILMMMGKSEPWMPAFLLKHKFPKKFFQQFLVNAGPYWRRLESVIHPRLQWLFAPFALRVWGFFVVVCCVYILVPGPLTNLLPALAILGLSMAILMRDGLLAIGTFFYGLVAMALLTLIYGSLLIGLLMVIQKVFM